MSALAASLPSTPLRSRVAPSALSMMFNPRGLWRFLKDSSASRTARVLAVLTVIYVISPIDLIPDWLVPFAGWLDDLGVATLALAWVATQAARYEAALPERTGPGGLPVPQDKG